MCTRSTLFDPIHGLVCPAPVPNAWDFPCLQHFSCWLHHPNFFLSFIHFFQASLPFSLWPAKPAKAHPSQPCTFPRHLEHPQHVICFFSLCCPVGLSLECLDLLCFDHSWHLVSSKLSCLEVALH